MLTYRVTHEGDEEVVVDYLGVVPAGEQGLVVSQYDADWFKRNRGVGLMEGNLPAGLTLTVVAEGVTE